MNKAFFETNIIASSAFESSLRESVMKVGTSSYSLIWYFFGSFSVATIFAVLLIPDFSFSLNLLLLDVLI